MVRRRAGTLVFSAAQGSRQLAAVIDPELGAEIAGRLYLAEATIKTHVNRLLAKLAVRDAAYPDLSGATADGPSPSAA